jgi:hypothetical protein
MPVKQSSIDNLKLINRNKRPCVFCGKNCSLPNIKRHEERCKNNPDAIKPMRPLKECPSCKKMHSKNGITCSYGCSNSYFRSGENNPNWNPVSYRSTCFLYHEKKCVVCGEEKIVAVHHIDENKKNCSPSNLVPLCPTHHQYVHSRYRDEVLPIVEEYMKNFKEKG